MGITKELDAENRAELTPGRVLIVALLYMISSDGEIDSEEVGYLLSILGGKRERGILGVEAEKSPNVERAIAYRSKHSIDHFLAEAPALLNTEQKYCLLLNLADCAMVDGRFEAGEQELFKKFLAAFHIEWQDFQPLYQVIARKNNRAIFFPAQ